MLPARMSGRPHDDLDACHFYRSEDQLVSLVVPYFRQGLQEPEGCIWLVRGPSEKARQAIGALADSQYSPDQLEVDDAGDWGDDERWKREECRALGLRIKALGTYRASSAEITAILTAHHAALVRRQGCWQRIPTTDQRAAQTILGALGETCSTTA